MVNQPVLGPYDWPESGGPQAANPRRERRSDRDYHVPARTLCRFYGFEIGHLQLEPAGIKQRVPCEAEICRANPFLTGGLCQTEAPQSVLAGRDLEGIAAKRRDGTYDPDAPTWVKIKNPDYSQAAGRHEHFDRRKSPGRAIPAASLVIGT
jgi:hypothetical protein